MDLDQLWIKEVYAYSKENIVNIPNFLKEKWTKRTNTLQIYVTCYLLVLYSCMMKNVSLSTFSKFWDFIFNYSSLYPFVWVTPFHVILKWLNDLSFDLGLYSPELAHSVQENENLQLILTEFRTSVKPQTLFLLSFQTVCHRIDEPGSNFWRSSGTTPLLRAELPRAGCSGLRLVVFWISARIWWRLHNFSGQPVPVFDHPRSKKFFSYV